MRTPYIKGHWRNKLVRFQSIEGKLHDQHRQNVFARLARERTHVRGRVRKFAKNTYATSYYWISLRFLPFHRRISCICASPTPMSFSPQEYFLSCDSFPFSAKTRRKAIKSRPTTVDSPQILELAIKTDFALYSSISSAFVTIISLRDTTRLFGNEL